MTDIILYNGELSRGLDLEFIETVDSQKSAKNAVLILVSNGGDADAAYKIGYYLQEVYDSFYVLLSGMCKSAGTLLAIAAKELIFTPYGELGLLDVQLKKEDKLGAQESGLNISEAFKAMEERSRDTYHNLIAEILSASNGVVSIRTAMNAASNMVSSLYGPIFQRFDPEEVGSRSRAMRIGEEYAKRLNAKWGNLKSESIEILSRSYPSHGFVINHDEAKLIFNNVRIANSEETRIIKNLGKLSRFQQHEPNIKFINGDINEEASIGDINTERASQQGKARRKRKADQSNTENFERTGGI
ncbi:MAG: SppA protein [Gammaproteobacteria bacterium]|nr:SppA protein [Gammaproteobacteria bacterium]